MSFKKNTLMILMGLLVCLSTQAQTSGLSNRSFFSKSQKIDNDGIELYESNFDLKSHKRFGVGLAAGGSNGMLGLNTEFNLDPENALAIGLGTGPNYGSVTLAWKNNYESRYLSPFTKLGYSKWFRASGVSGGATDSDVLRRVYSDSDLRAGKFDPDFLVAGVGAEYNQLEGEFSGVNFFGELILLTELKTAKLVPTGALGVIYFY